MEYYSNQISLLIEQLASLPGIGSKTAQRLAFYIIDMPSERVEKLAETIKTAKSTIRYCSQCLLLVGVSDLSSAHLQQSVPGPEDHHGRGESAGYERL